jgi:hypothetical protein
MWLAQRALLWIISKPHWGAAIRAVAANDHDEDEDDCQHDDQPRRRHENWLVDKRTCERHSCYPSAERLETQRV